MLLYKVPGFTYDELYTMPIHLRTFYFKEYKEWKKAENQTAENADQGQEQAYQQYVQNHQQNTDS